MTVYEEMEGYGDIYDRKNDPDELNNLWHDENNKSIRFKLLDKLLHEMLKAQTKSPKRIAGS